MPLGDRLDIESKQRLPFPLAVVERVVIRIEGESKGASIAVIADGWEGAINRLCYFLIMLFSDYENATNIQRVCPCAENYHPSM